MPGYFGRVAGTNFFAGTAFAVSGTIKIICWYIFAGNATSRDCLWRYPVQQQNAPPVIFRRECNMPEIDANEVNQLASLTGRTVGFATSSEGDGCTRTRHRHLGRRGPCTTFSTDWGSHPKRSLFCLTAHAKRCGQVASVGLHGWLPSTQ